jgi:hypothetical protein
LWANAFVHTLRPRLAERRFRIPKAATPNEPLTRLQNVLKAHDVAWCTTGATAALELTHYYQTDVLEIYAEPGAMTNLILRELKAQPTADEANLIVIEPPIPDLMRNAAEQGEPFPVAPALLAYAELRYHETDQAAEAAELLLPLIEEPDAPAP